VLNFSFLLFIYSMGFSMLLYSAFLVYGPSPGFHGVSVSIEMLFYFYILNTAIPYH
jgi:hypothetical protein